MTVQSYFRHNQRLKYYIGQVDFAGFSLQASLQGLGFLVLASTDKGLCALSFVDQAEDAEDELRGMMPRAQLVHNQHLLHPMAEKIIRGLEDNQPITDITLDIFGTPFQQQVWRALIDIPHGEQRRYGGLAQYLGVPKASRAVGTACGANAISLLIPCHRVVGQSGDLTGYRWGTQRKQWLLEHEKHRAAA